MKKIKTIFERDWEGNRKVIDKYTEGVYMAITGNAVPTEKVDGTNIRITVRNHSVVRVEKRRNPDKIQKAKGIEDPWYMDADPYSPNDKYIFEAVANTDFSEIPDGEYSAEAFGKNIQGNPLNMERNQLYIFSYHKSVQPIPFVPTTYEELKEWLPKQKSRIGNGFIEGVVWNCADGEMFKIKAKDF